MEGKQAKLIVVLNAAAEAEDKLKSANAQCVVLNEHAPSRLNGLRVANLQERLQEKEQHAAEL